MKIISLLLLTTIISNNVVYSQQNLQLQVKSFTKNSRFENASISVSFYDIEGDSTIAAHHQNQSLVTASTAKLFSTATALEILGSDYRPSTKVFIEGKIDSVGILHGNIIIKGEGDPTLGSKYFHSKENRAEFLSNWAFAIKNKGITGIKGNIIVDGSDFGYAGAPDGWNWNDLGNYYGAGPSGVCVYDNMVELFFSTSSANGGKTKLKKTDPEMSGVKFTNYVLASNKTGDNSYIYGAPFSSERFITGELPKGRSNYIVKGSIPDPEKQLGQLFMNYMDSIGIEINGKVAENRILERKIDYSTLEEIAITKGASILEIATITNMKSVNLFAEQLLCLSGYKTFSNGSTNSGLKAMQNYWSERINTKGLYITDGSGLSRSNGISAQHFINLLVYMKKSNNYTNYLSTLPTSGISGTLRNFCKNQSGHGKIHAKSGSIARVKSYAGYIETRSGRLIAFAVIINNFDGSSSSAKKEIEKLLNVASLM